MLNMLSQLHIQKSDKEWEVIHGNMQSTVWDDFTLDRQGDLTEWLYTHHRDEYTENWNRLAKEYSPIVKKYVTELANTQTINDDLASYLEWDLIHLLIEGYFQKLEILIPYVAEMFINLVRPHIGKARIQSFFSALISCELAI